ncbi:hypothetical protein BHM03_00051541 [Ensete ventricosum]|nr:hypothetical protein BHM03_00051541 [Ensete ventricosum]
MTQLLFRLSIILRRAALTAQPVHLKASKVLPRLHEWSLEGTPALKQSIAHWMRLAMPSTAARRDEKSHRSRDSSVAAHATDGRKRKPPPCSFGVCARERIQNVRWNWSREAMAMPHFLTMSRPFCHGAALLSHAMHACMRRHPPPTMAPADGPDPGAVIEEHARAVVCVVMYRAVSPAGVQ